MVIEHLQKEINDLRNTMDKKEKEYKGQLESYLQEASNAKLELANVNMNSQEQIMKLKRLAKKYGNKLESMGVKLSELK